MMITNTNVKMFISFMYELTQVLKKVENNRRLKICISVSTYML